jgi:hypothetical protein
MNNYLKNKKSHRTDVGWLKSLTKGMMKWSMIRLPDAAESSGDGAKCFIADNGNTGSPCLTIMKIDSDYHPSFINRPAEKC